MSSKAYELLTQVKNLCLVEGTSDDTKILQMMNLIQWELYNSNFRWRCLQTITNAYTTELLTLDVAPSTIWAVGDTIRGATSLKTCIIVDVLTSTTYNIKDRSGAFTLGEVLSNGTYTADQGLLYPTVSSNSYIYTPSSLAMIFDVRQTSTSPYVKLSFLEMSKFHESVPQPTTYAEGTPVYYSWWGGKLWLYPIPDETYTLTISGYSKPVNMKIYTTVTSQHSGLTVTGTSTYFSSNANVDTNMFYTYQGDVRSDGTYPWSFISAVSSATAMTISAYTGASGATTVAYACSSASSFAEDFDQLLIYKTCIMYGGRLREFDTKFMEWLMEMEKKTFAGLLDAQSYYPDSTPILEDFSPSGGVGLGDKYKYPFIVED